MIGAIIIIGFVLSLQQLLNKLNRSFPILELTVVLYVLQYLVAPLLVYNYYPLDVMKVPKEEYLPFTLVAVFAFAVGLFSLKSKFDSHKFEINKEQASRLGRVLICIGFLSQMAMGFFPEALKSTLGFFILFKSIGVFALVFSNKRIDKLIIIAVSIQIAVEAVLNAMLIDFIVYILFFSMFFCLRYKVKNKVKYLLLIFGFLFFTIVQSIKEEYRETVWETEVSMEQKIILFGKLINRKTSLSAFNTDIRNNVPLLRTMYRLNQGWQTSKLYNHVPSEVGFQYGREFIKDVISSFVPRLFWENKRVVNDHERFYYYTGYFEDEKSMTVGVIGDFYLNFGKTGCIIVLFLFGHFIARVKRFFMTKLVDANPINLIWLPFIFSYLIRPNNEFYMVFNHLVKSVLVLIVVVKVIYPLLKIENEEVNQENRKKRKEKGVKY